MRQAGIDATLEYLTVATLPSTSAHAAYVRSVCGALSEAGFKVTVLKVGWSRLDGVSGVRFVGLAPRLPGAGARSIAQAVAFLARLPFTTRSLVVTHNALCAAVCRLAGVKYVYDAHGKVGRARLLRFALSKGGCRAMIFNSAGTEVAFRQSGLPIPRITAVIGNGSSEFQSDATARRRFRSRHGISDRADVTAYIGSLGTNRGMDVVRQALLKMDMRDRKFIIAGGSPSDIQRERAAFAAAGLSDAVLFLGFLSQRELSDVMNGADTLLVSYSSAIGTADVMNPMKVHEYMSTDRAIVYPSLERVNEVIGDDPGSFQYTADDPISLAHALVQASACDRRAECERYRGPRRVTWKAVAERFKDVLARALQE